MRKLFVAAAVLVAIGVPAALAASSGSDTPAAHSRGGDSTAKACKGERQSIGAEAFAKKYGTNHKLRDAFGKCVSGTSKDDRDEDDKAEKSSGAAKSCRAQHASMGDGFAQKYGTNHNLKNAFGKCVSSKAKDKVVRARKF